MWLVQSELFYKAVYRKRRLHAGGIQEIIWKMSTDACKNEQNQVDMDGLYWY